MNDPTRTLKRLIVATAAVGLVGGAVCALWALQPLPEPTPIAAADVMSPAPEQQPDAAAGNDDASSSFNTDAFLVTLWHPPEAPPPPPPEELATAEDEQTKPKPEPLRVQLVAIIEEAGTLQAALFDQQDNRIVIVSSGDVIRGHEVRVRSDAVEFMRDGQKQTLPLRPDERLAKGGR